MKLLDQAAHYFIDAEEPVRAAEIRHDQNRFAESADLYLKADLPELAARIFSQQDMHLEAADAHTGHVASAVWQALSTTEWSISCTI